ncbi:MAG: HIT family protein [Lachnospiraceae bacterium]|nr:HIT family protein [Lachnospiraceae bacterium]
MNDNCIFCKIANGVIGSNTLYEDDDFRVIFDAGPATFGHALILPKTHAEDLFSLPGEVAAKVLPLAAKVGAVLKEETGCDGLNLVQNNGEAAGQTVHHFHVHMIPRYEGDGPMVAWVPGEPEQEKLKSLAEKISGHF